MLVVAGGNASEVFDPIEEPFHEISLPVDPGGEGEACLAIGLGRDIGPSSTRGRLCPDGIAVISFVGQQNVTFAEVVNEGISFSAIGDLAAGQA